MKINITIYKEEKFYNLKDVCDYIKIKYESVLEKGVCKLKNDLDNLEYVYDNDSNVWVSRCGLYVLFNNSNVKINF